MKKKFSSICIGSECAFLTWIGFLLLCSCSVQKRVAPAKQLPAEMVMNKEAGRGGHLTVMVKFNGEEMPFLLDSGAPVTALDKSLEGKLAKGYGSASIQITGGGAKQQTTFHAPPELFLGETPLTLGKYVCTYDFKRQPMGILGMDCLEHYCVQLDFERRKVRFLNSSDLKTNELGRCFRFTMNNGYPMIESAGLIRGSINPLIDLGCNIDALIDRGTNRQEGLYLPECRWNNQNYAGLIVASVEDANLIGLRFLARHLVTFDFPNRRVFLKQTCVDIVDDPDAESPRMSGLGFLMKMRKTGMLPGWAATSKEAICFQSSIGTNSSIFKFWKQNVPTVNEYQIVRASKTNDWKLIKAVRRDFGGELVEEFQIP